MQVKNACKMCVSIGQSLNGKLHCPSQSGKLKLLRFNLKAS